MMMEANSNAACRSSQLSVDTLKQWLFSLVAGPSRQSSSDQQIQSRTTITSSSGCIETAWVFPNASKAATESPPPPTTVFTKGVNRKNDRLALGLALFGEVPWLS
jgi:hypothetical protein